MRGCESTRIDNNPGRIVSLRRSRFKNEEGSYFHCLVCVDFGCWGWTPRESTRIDNYLGRIIVSLRRSRFKNEEGSYFHNESTRIDGIFNPPSNWSSTFPGPRELSRTSCLPGRGCESTRIDNYLGRIVSLRRSRFKNEEGSYFHCLVCLDFRCWGWTLRESTRIDNNLDESTHFGCIGHGCPEELANNKEYNTAYV